MKKAVDFSIIVAVGRTDKLLDNCVASLVNQDFPKSKYEIILVTDNKIEKAYGKNVKILFSHSVDPASKRNFGSKKSLGRYLAYIDDDATAPPGWLRLAGQILKKNGKVAGVGGPNILAPGSSILEILSDEVLRSPLSGQRCFCRDNQGRTIARAGDLTTCNLFIKKEVFDRTGGFPTIMGYGGEDAEFILRGMARFGFTFVYDPDLYVYHQRRKFGLSFLKQRFLIKRGTGKLIVVYPQKYLFNFKVLAFLFSFTGLLVCLLVQPGIFLLGIFVYWAATTLLALWAAVLRGRPWLVLVLPPALFVTHLVYYLAILVGMLNLKQIFYLRCRR